MAQGYFARVSENKGMFHNSVGQLHPIDPIEWPSSGQLSITMVTDRLEGFALRETKGKKLWNCVRVVSLKINLYSDKTKLMNDK